MKLTRYIGFLIVCFLFCGTTVGQTFDQDDCPRGPVIRVPITSLTKAVSADFMVLTDSCGNQYYTLKDSVTTKGGVINQYFAGDTLITITQGDTFITIINLQGDTTGTGRFRAYDNLGANDTIFTFPAGVPTDNLLVTNGLNIDAGTPMKLKLGGRLIEDTDIYGTNYTYNMKWDSINLFRSYANSNRFYSNQSFLVQSNNSPTMYVQIQSPTSMYLRADTVLHIDLYNHSLTDTSHLLIRTDRARDGSWVKGGFLQLLRTTSGIHQGEADWSLYALPLTAPPSTGNYSLNYSSGSKTFSFSSIPTNPPGGSGTLNYIPKWTPDGNTLGNSSMYESPVGSVYFPTNMYCSAGSWYFNSPSSGIRIIGSPMSISPNITIGANSPVNTIQKLVIRGNGNTPATLTEEWQNLSGQSLGWKRDDGAVQHNTSAGIVSLYATFDVMYACNNGFNWANYTGNRYFRNNTDSTFTLGTSDRRWLKVFTKYARITDNDGTPTTIMGRDADGDVGTVTIGSGLTLAGGSLSASATALLYWTESLATYDTATVWTPKTGTNVAAVVTPRGNGAFIVGKAPDGTTAGGNARGDYAIDLQNARTAANHVASGNYSVAMGSSSRASGLYSLVLGYDADATGTSSIAIGSESQATSSQAIAIGYQANASTTFATAVGPDAIAGGIGSSAVGLSTEAVGAYSTSTGYRSKAHLQNERSHAGGWMSTEGDAQTSDLRVHRKITGTAASELFLDGTSLQAILTAGGANPANRIWNARIQVTASTRDPGNGSGATGDSFIGNYEVGIKRIGSATSLVGGGVITNSIESDTGMSGAVVTITADDTTEALKVTFTPPTSAGSTTQTHVVATIYLTELAF